MSGLLLNVTHQVVYSTGMLQLYHYLKVKNYSIEYADVNYDEEEYNFAIQKLKKNPNLYKWIGLHADYQTISETISFVEKLSQWNYKGHISLGGIFPTMYPEQYFDKMPIDSIVLGEGEKVVEELLQKLENGEDWTTVPGVAWRCNGTIKRNPNLFLPVSWDEIPEDIRLINVHWKRNAVYIPSSLIRSCKNFCSWCPERFTERAAGTLSARRHNLPIQYKSFYRIKKEIMEITGKFRKKFAAENYAEENKFISFYILDNDAFSEKELIDRNVELALWFKDELIPVMNSEEIKVGWFLWATTGSVLDLHDDYLKLLKSPNLTVLVGFESFSNSQLKRLGKRTTREQNIQAYKKLGLNAGVLMILWDPFSTPAELLESWSTYDSIMKCPKPPDFELMNKYLVLLPGTPMYKKFISYNKKYILDEFGALNRYELVNPDANSLQAILSQYVHYWIKLRGFQQSLCVNLNNPNYINFRKNKLDKCTFCEIGRHKETYFSFKDRIIEIMKLAVEGNKNWEKDAINLTHVELRRLKKELSIYEFDGSTLYEMILKLQK